MKKAAFILALAMLLGVAAGCGQSAGEASVQSVSMICGLGSAGMTDRFAGVVSALGETNIKKDDSMTIGEIKVKAGDAVNVGDVLFTYDCEDNGRSYVVFTTGEGAQQRLFANRYDTRDDGQLALLALENEQEYAIIKHCFEELKAKLAEQAAEAAAQEGEPEA